MRHDTVNGTLIESSNQIEKGVELFIKCMKVDGSHARMTTHISVFIEAIGRQLLLFELFYIKIVSL